MEDTSTNSQPQGFNPQVVNQLHQIAMSNPPTNHARGQHRRGRGRAYNAPSGGHIHGTQPPPAMASLDPQPSWSAPASVVGTDINAFPPLGSGHPQQPSYHRQGLNKQTPQVQSRQGFSDYQRQSQYQQMPQNQYARGNDGYGRARGNAYRQHQNSQVHTQSYGGQPRVVNNGFNRPPPQPANRLYNHVQGPYHGTHDQQKSLRHRVMLQSDFLASLASQSLKNQVTQEELVAKEAFRKKIQLIAQGAVASLIAEPGVFDPTDIRLKLYGSLGSGFAVTGSDMDLLLVFPKHEGPLNIEIESRRAFEKALLDEGIGARLLTNTRVPILKVCERPHPALLEALHQCRVDWELQESFDLLPPDLGNNGLPELDMARQAAAVEALTLLHIDDAANIPLPASPIPEQARLEFSGDCGIQCDINFANHVALHNTELLRTYGASDPRVRQMGIFVKNWAKARDINTPYLGTLSSYGYILMVLHYLMNIASPPVIPNLQHLQKTQDQWKAQEDLVIPRVDGFDVRFVRDPEEVQQIKQSMLHNHDSLGALLRGFFWYYSQPQGFHWGRDVISIRTHGGRLSKQAKGWTEAKWANQTQKSHVRLRYLLAIEDPFETEHNVGRTVGHHGIVAIRDEFRRAWSIVDAVEYDTLNKTYSWTDKDGRQDAAQLMASLTDRGDLLRKDQNFHKDKIRRMRQEAEAKEQTLKTENLQETASVSSAAEAEVEINGTWVDELTESSSHSVLSAQNNMGEQQLIGTRYQNNNRIWRNRSSRRQVEGEQCDVNDHDDTDDAQRDTHEEETSWWNASDPRSNTNPEKVDRQSHTNNTKIEDFSVSTSNNSQSCSQEVSGRKPHFQSMGDRIFARDHKADTFLQPHNRPLHSSRKVGDLIQWDKQTEAGQWLRWRDRAIRAGSRMVFTDPVLMILDEEFPHDPNMTYAQLSIHNERLRNHYAKTLVRVNDALILVKQSDGNASEDMELDNTEAAEDEVPLVEERPSSPEQAVDSGPNGFLDTNPSVTTTSLSPSVEQLREMRTQYYSQYVNTRKREQNSEVDTRDQANILETNYQDSDLQLDDDVMNHQQKLLSLLNVRATPSNSVQHFDNHDFDKTRDIHSELAFLLHRAGFQFDSRQLADLDIIRQGGNGCARDGQAFAVEEDYELGGGGAMASKSSTGRRCVSESGIMP